MEDNLSYELIVEKEKLVDPSLAALLYGETFQERIDVLSYSNRINHLHNLFLMYAVLIQAYIIARAVDNQSTIEDLELPQPLTEQISDYWHGKYDLADENNVFSFLIGWSRSGQEDIIDSRLPADVFSELGSLYADYCKNVRSMPNMDSSCNWFDTERYLALLECLPLLSACSLDEKRDVLVFQPRTERVIISCIPFFFHNKNANFLEHALRSKVYLFTSAWRGEKNDWPILQLFDLSCGKKKQLRIDAGNEGIRIICRSVGLSTVWYSVEDCWCDLAYLKRVIDATGWVLKKYLRVMHNGDIYSDIKQLFYETELYNKLDDLHGGKKEVYSSKDQLDAFLYEMFITFGVFRSLFGLFMDPWENPYSEKLFDLYMEYFRDESIITAEREEVLRNQLMDKIAEHTEKLKRISPEYSKNYRVRKREILAEWNAFAVLQAAGIDSNSKLFADKERMLSIDDYYQMVRNPSTTIEDDLCDVLTLLNCIYGPLVDSAESVETKNETVQYKFDENAYLARMMQYQHNMQEQNLEDLFDMFLDIIARSDNNPAVQKCLGRNNIIRSVDVIPYRNEILRCLAEKPRSMPVRTVSDKKIFISYCHADADAVMECCAILQNNGFNVIIDERRFRAGSDWKEIAKKIISADDCTAVLVFFSKNVIFSDAVEFELNHAQRNKKAIIAVNLETSQPLIYEYLDDIEHSSCHERNYAGQLKQYFPKNNIFVKPDQYFSKLIPDLQDLFYEKETEIGDFVDGPYTELEEQVINFYALLKYGYECDSSNFGFRRGEKVNEFFSEEMEKKLSVNRCIFPLIVSVRETKIKRDNIALIGYEIIKNNTTAKRANQYILSSKRLDTDDYYCIPNYRLTGSDGTWMVEPFLVKRWNLLQRRDLLKEEHYE